MRKKSIERVSAAFAFALAFVLVFAFAVPSAASADTLKTAAASEQTGDFSGMSDEEYTEYLKEQGFPNAYRKKLLKLHRKHPNWIFKAYASGIEWDYALSKQTTRGTSLIHKSLPKSYRNGNTQYEPGWYKADGSVVAYYMDPRHFLNEDRIFMFEDLSYRDYGGQKAAVRAILKPTKLPLNGFKAKLFINAGKKSGVSPVHLASRARQETGGGGDAVNGTKIFGKKVYNPFNIGAFGGSNPLKKGLLYAYAKGWTTQKKAVNGGAKTIGSYYINKGQNTLYYQRFNIRNGLWNVGTHQYMTNIMAVYSEAYSAGQSYKKYGITEHALVFEIPVYKSMPKKTALPD